jgi:DNA-binding transcriptional ArsR family regulator
MGIATPMRNADVRAHVLRELYDQEMRGEFHGLSPKDFAMRIGVPQRQIEVALKYLVDMGLLKGTYVVGTDVPIVFGITALGMDVVDNPRKFPDVEVTQQIVQVSGDVYSPITQVQGSSTVIQSFGDLSNEVDKHQEVPPEERSELKHRLEELTHLFDEDSVSRTRLNEILSYLRKYSWLYPTAVEIVRKMLTPS